MDNYTKSLMKIGFFITLFTVVLLLGIFYIYRAFGNVKWPPESQKCPDHWVAKDVSDFTDVGESSGTTVCHDIYQLAGDCGDDGQITSSDTVTKMTGCFSGGYYMNVDDEEQTGMWTSLCNKKAWADGNNLTWDGITNNSYNCS
jgi:hypothetical protein